ncbi:MAG TPA: serine/threonine-protein kinase [Gemmatimonadaceae bacterium]|nr:serine/threonine-protein kinase [Gemmatimonadaceae bacterium]
MSDHLLDRLVVAVGTQYLVDAEIGRGGMAVVYRARDIRLNRRVAIKLLPPELAFNADVRERFLREAQTSAQLAHPGIVPIYTVGESEGLVYFVMALVDGETLGERLLREKRLPIAQVRAILVAVADALAYAHANGVVHRDIKPDNIMLERGTDRAVVTDFGIARAAAGDSRLTVTGVAIGTPAYMSPEQALGERELDGRSDIYSLGIIGYQMLAGEPPFKASNTPAMLVKHVSETPRPLEQLRPDAPRALVNAIARALAKRPEDRWRDAAQFRDAVSGTLDATPYADRPAASMVPARPLPPQRGWESAGPAEDPHSNLPSVPPLPPMPAMPTWGTKAEWKEWRRDHKQWELQRKRRERAVRRGRDSGEFEAARPVEDRITSFRRKSIGSIATVASLAVVNVVTSPDFFWFLIPGAFMTLGVLSHAGRLWADGIPLGRLFARGGAGLRASPGAGALPSASGASGDAALQLAPADVLAGSHGDTVRRAASDRVAVRETLARLAPEEREMIPDVGPTVDALAQRVGSLALTLHRLDADVGGASVSLLDARITALRAEGGESPSAEQERRIALLERQRTTIGELTERRGVLAAQLESASLALQNLRLDLLKLRSSGLGSAMSDVANATQEAKALSRDIGHAVDAVREVKRL